MITQMEKKVTEKQIAALYHEIRLKEDSVNAGKMLDMLEKYQNEEFIITLTGHFSAGKSSLINQLLHKDILANSPIPTSANIVKISSGKGTVQVFFHNGEVVEYREPYDLNRIKQFSKNKEAIKKIHISTGEKLLPPQTAILDTPGIDAADDVDRMLTEASLHLSDYLIYVTDYNHVQSEVNLLFLQAMQKNGLPFMIVINQIDKHNEAELPFVEFDKKIKQTFDQWNLQPSSIFYTSLKNPDAAHNEWIQLKETVFNMLKHKAAYTTMEASIRQIIRNHKEKMHRKMSNQKNDLSELDEKEIDADIKTLTEKITQIKQSPIDMETHFLKEVEQTAKNAYLMPADLRELAHAYLESAQPDFKVGGLFRSMKKTEEAKKERTVRFMKELQANVQSNLQWKLRDKWYEMIEKYQLDSGYQEKGVAFLDWTLTEETLQNQLRKGATINGDYVLNYTNEIAASVKSHFKRRMKQLVKEVRKELEEMNQEQVQELLGQLEQLERMKTKQQKNNDLADQEAAYFAKLEELQIDPPEIDTSVLEMMYKQLETRIVIPKQESELIEGIEEEKAAVPDSEGKEERPAGRQRTAVNRDVLKDISCALEIIDLPGFESYQQDLKKRKTSLTERSYTIALFGAFSAGKSSFANAILGESVLPVSPNPTTAAVNRIRPVTEENNHQDIIVTFKDENMLIDDIRTLAKDCQPPEAGLVELIGWLQEENVLISEKLPKMYQAYLTAIVEGYDQVRENIGSAAKITFADFETYVTDERKACYIASMDLFYDCAVTRQGITLVDTPGADSINARHTNVSFEYIKHADAILYVTYYNHALSRADKDFLMQLGRVKDVFELDKMFFIVNAADLASNQEELDLVTDYVKEQLVQLGIRFPRLFPLSSKNSLVEKKKGIPLNKQMQQFESTFYDFIHHDLTALAKTAAMRDIERAGGALEQFIQSLQLDHSEKNTRKTTLKTAYGQIEKWVEALNTNSSIHRWYQKIEKQAYFLEQRFAIRFHDLFKEIYNPTTITESGKAGREQLQKQFEQLAAYMEKELHQELLAISLRIEHLAVDLMKAVQQEMLKKAEQMDSVFSISEWDIEAFATPEFNVKLLISDYPALTKIFAKFKDTKTFFVQNQKEELKTWMYEIIQTDIKKYINEGAGIIQSVYNEQWNRILQQEKENFLHEMAVLYKQFINRLFVQVDMDDLIRRKERIREIATSYGKEEN